MLAVWVRLWPSISKGGRDDFEQVARHRIHVGLALQVGEHHGEFVTARAGELVADADELHQTLIDPRYQSVRHQVAVALVATFEVIQIEQQHGQRTAVSAGVPDLLIELLHEDGRAGQLGEHVHRRKAFHLLVGGTDEAIVDQHADVVSQGACLIPHRFQRHVLQIYLAVLATVPYLAGPPAVFFQSGIDDTVEGLVVPARLQHDRCGTQHLFRLIPGYHAERAIHEQYPALCIGDDDAIPGTFQCAGKHLA